jgi:aminobenzoyl-glutamate transport protein
MLDLEVRSSRSLSRKYDKNAGVGSVVSRMLPDAVLMFVLWTVLFAVWKSIGLPWGL